MSITKAEIEALQKGFVDHFCGTYGLEEETARAWLEAVARAGAKRNIVTISIAEHDALMAAAKALKRYHHPPSKIDAPDCPCCNCEGERAIAVLRAAGIEPSEDKT